MQFDWRTSFASGNVSAKYRFATEEEYINHLKPNKRAAYLRRRAKRYKKFLMSIKYQRFLRLEVIRRKNITALRKKVHKATMRSKNNPPSDTAKTFMQSVVIDFLQSNEPEMRTQKT